MMDLIDMAQDKDRWWAIVNTVMKFQVSKNGENFLTSLEPINFPRRTLLPAVSTRTPAIYVMYYFFNFEIMHSRY